MSGTKPVKPMLPSPESMGCRGNVFDTGAADSEMGAIGETDIGVSQPDC
jgi:hypothetical protein